MFNWKSVIVFVAWCFMAVKVTGYTVEAYKNTV